MPALVLSDDEDDVTSASDVAIRRTYELMCLDDDDVLPEPPPAASPEVNIRAAHDFRTYMEDHAATQLCAVCGCYCAPADMCFDRTLISNVPSLELLQAHPGLPQDRMNGFPRASLTITTINGVAYCLEPKAYHPEDDSIDLCLDCHAALEKVQVPRGSLVRFDIGPDPLGPDGFSQLLPMLTWLESWLVAPLRIHQTILICFPKNEVWEAGTHYYSPRQKAQMGHCYSKHNPDLKELTTAIPFDLSRIPEFIQVVYCSWRKKDEDPLTDEIRKMECAKVRGPLVIRIAHHLVKVNIVNGLLSYSTRIKHFFTPPLHSRRSVVRPGRNAAASLPW